MYSSPFEDPTFRVPDLTVGEVELLLRDNAETIKLLLGVVREWFIPMMQNYSEEIWCAGWLQDLEVSLPQMIPSVAIAAGLLGEIPFWDDSVKLQDFDDDPIRWKKYDVTQIAD